MVVSSAASLFLSSSSPSTVAPASAEVSRRWTGRAVPLSSRISCLRMKLLFFLQTLELIITKHSCNYLDVRLTVKERPPEARLTSPSPARKAASICRQSLYP